MPLSPEEKAARIQQAAQMRAEQTKHSVKLDELRTRFKCSGEDAFKVLNGIDLESDLRDQIFQYFCGEPGKGLRTGHGPAAPAKIAHSSTPGYPIPGRSVIPAPAAPPPRQVVDLITRPSQQGQAARPPVGEPYQPPKPDPVPAPVVEAHAEPAGIPISERPADTPAPAPFSKSDLLASTAAAQPPAHPAPAPAKTTNTHGKLADPEVGERIRTAMEAAGHTAKSLGIVLGHSSGSNVSAALSRSGSRSLQNRLCDMLALDHDGHPIPGKTHTLPAPGGKPATVATPATATMKPDEKKFLAPEPAGSTVPAGPGKIATTAAAMPGRPPVPMITDHNRAVGIRIKRRIEELGYTPRQVAWHLGYSNAGNVGAVIKGYHHPELRQRLLSVLGLNAEGYPAPNSTIGSGATHALPDVFDIHPPEIPVDAATLVSADRLNDAARALGDLGHASGKLKEAAALHQAAEAEYKRALAAVQRLGIRVNVLEPRAKKP